MVADHFEVEVEDIPVLAKYLAEEPDVWKSSLPTLLLNNFI
jgi:hypothetical protein